MGQVVKSRDSQFIPTGLTLAEQAVHLLRRSGAPALLAYYTGSLPFALGLLYFWSDMSRNPMADQYCGPAAAGLALLFIWMKYWQVRFCRRLTWLLLGVSRGCEDNSNQGSEYCFDALMHSFLRHSVNASVGQ